ncbi:porin [Azohydromonas aeria]|uniref:porin n=1 Tax=Azohydromonas aeria TaxID=2590212 RepID=UPI0012F9F8E6|nr:porin [Azohydromonas aeria]
MKKSLIALAALGAFAGAASAQSSVTLYGLVDLSYQYTKAGDDAPLAGDSVSRLTDGTAYGPGSRWGLRVSEDLGSGLKANVVLESGFNADDGTGAQGALFGRQAFVSLASAVAGEVRLGRQYTLHDEVQVLNNPFGNSTVLNPGAGAFGNTAAGRVPLFIDAVRQNNAIQYISPSFGGFRLQGMVALDESSGTGTGTDRYYGIKGTYGQGPLNVALSYEQSKDKDGGAGGGTVNKIASLGANYDFGVAKVFAGYQQGKDLAAGPGFAGSLATPDLVGAVTKLKAFTVGASVPFGAFTVGANYTKSKLENAAGADTDLAKAGLVATYSLSKTTTVYTGYAQALGDLKDDVNEKRVFQLGLRKAF